MTSPAERSGDGSARGWSREKLEERPPEPTLDCYDIVDPTLVDRRDPTPQIWRPHAFPAFGPSDAWELARRAIASGRRRDHPPVANEFAVNSLLPTVSCGAPTDEGHRCGYGVAAVVVKDKGLMYIGAQCPESQPPHRTNFYLTAEAAIVSIIAHAYDTDGVERLLANIALRANSLRQRLAEVQRQLTIVEGELAGVAQNEAMAAAAHDECDRAFWRERRLPVLAERRALRTQLDDLTERLAGVEDSSGVARHIAVARRVTAQLPELLERSKAFYGRTRELISLLVRSMAIRQVTPGLMLFELELPTGQVSHHLIISDNFRCTQPERLLSYVALRAGEDPAVTAARLADARTRRGEGRLANAETVLSFALLHAYFECVAPREGRHFTVEALSAAWCVDLAVVNNAGLEGRLGPARIADGQALVYCPTAEEALAVSPWLGKVEVAARLGVDPDALVTTAEMSEALGVSATALGRSGVRWRHGSTDSVGRRVLLRSHLPAAILKALREYSPADFRRRQRDVLLKELVRADFATEQADCWHRAHEVRSVFRRRLGMTSVSTLSHAAKRGHIDQCLFSVPEPGRNGHSLTLFVFVPAGLLEEGTAADVHAWLHGAGPRAVRVGDGRRARVNNRRGPRKPA